MMLDLIEKAAGAAITALMAFYLFQSFLTIFVKDERKKNLILIPQCLTILLMHLACFGIMYLKKGSIEILFFYLAQLVYLVAVLVFYRVIYPKASRMAINHMGLLIMIGLVMNTRLNFDRSIHHFQVLVIASVIGLFIPIIIQKITILVNWYWVYAILGIGGLGAVAVLARTTYGAKLGFTILGINIQPSEFIKITFVFAVAGILGTGKQFWRILLATMIAGLHVLILVYSTDLGSALIFFITYLVMLYIATRKVIYPLLGMLAGSGAAVLAFQLFPHVQQRVQIWQNPFADYTGTGYQIVQSMFSIAAGGWLGKGLMNGSPNNVPLVSMDSMLAAIAEELGSVFAILLILVCLSCYILFVTIAMRLKNRYYSVVGMGLGTLYGVQVFLTIGGTMKLIPMTGVTLPLISYGGSSILSTILIFSIIQGLYILRDDEDSYIIETEHNQAATMNPSVRKYYISTISLFSLFFLSLAGYLVYFHQNLSEELKNNEYNTKELVFQKPVIRGSIYSADGEVLARTNTDETGNEHRIYPWGAMFSHVVGYSENGKTGLEAVYDRALLTATSLKEEEPETELDLDKMQDLDTVIDTIKTELEQREEERILQAENKIDTGDSLHLTIDSELQYAAYQALGSYKGAIVAMEPKTGKILAMVSKPDFDPNEVGIMWDIITAPSAEGPLVNRATQGLYTPGSVFKIVTTLAYLQEHPEDFDNYSYNCYGSLKKNEVEISCFNHATHGYENLKASFQHSCNTSYANIGIGLNVEKWAELTKDLLFDAELPTDLPYSQSHFYLNNASSEDEIMTTAIGQGSTSVSPFHMALITSAIANNGKLMQPYVVDHITNADGEQVSKTRPTTFKKMISSQDASVLQTLMRSVVEGGTGKALNECSFSVAGKTGSAEYLNVEADEYRTHSWFVGYSNVEDPDLVVVVIAEDGGTGSETAVPVAKEVFESYYER